MNHATGVANSYPYTQNVGFLKSHLSRIERAYYTQKKVPIQCKDRNAPLIHTCYYNPTKSRYTCYMITIDLDYDKVTNPRFLVQNKISWRKVKKYIRKHHSYIFKSLFASSRSYSGRGLTLAFAITPLALPLKEEEDSPKCKAVHIAERFQKALQHIFDLAGCGVDIGATGLNRWCTNWQKEDQRLYYNPKLLIKAQRKRREKTPLISRLFKRINKDPLLAYEKKEDNLDKFLAKSCRTEKGMAKLFKKLKENSKPLVLPSKEIVALTGLDKDNVRDKLKNPYNWLEAKHLGKFTGWKLSLSEKTTKAQIKRYENIIKNPASIDFKNVPLKAPESVVKGERNQQITLWILYLKWAGYEYNTTLQHILKLSKRVLDQSKSRNLGDSNIKSKVNALYFSKRHKRSFGSRASSLTLPEWLTPEKSQRSFQGKLKNRNYLEVFPFGETIKRFPKETTRVPSLWDGTHKPLEVRKLIGNQKIQAKSKILKVSTDHHFAWSLGKRTKKNGKQYNAFHYYSAPYRPKNGVRVFDLDETIEVFDSETKEFLCSHKKSNEDWSFTTIKSHVRGLSMKEYLDYLEKNRLYPERQISTWKIMDKYQKYKSFRKILDEKRKLDKYYADAGLAESDRARFHLLEALDETTRQRQRRK